MCGKKDQSRMDTLYVQEEDECVGRWKEGGDR